MAGNLMYIPKPFQQHDRQDLINAMRAVHFGALIVFAEGRFYSSHIPFLVKEKNKNIVLEGHISKANELWQVALPQNKAMVIFQGAHAYISPSWYPTKTKTGKVVPTWNYQVIHCHGVAEAQHEEQWRLSHVTDLTNRNEAEQVNPWHINDAPSDYINSQLNGIVGIQFIVEHMEGTLKMNQHHVEENRMGAINGLLSTQKSNECEVARIMRQVKLKK